MKVQKFAGLTLLAAKGDFQLIEFRAARKSYLEQVLSVEQLAYLESSATQDRTELFEGLGTDLAELKGHCVIIPAAHNYSNLNRTDNIIKLLHPMLSPELARCSSFESTLAALFQLKEKWTLTELESILKKTLEPE